MEKLNKRKKIQKLSCHSVEKNSNVIIKVFFLLLDGLQYELPFPG